MKTCGRLNTYKHGCRCDLCKTAAKTHYAENRAVYRKYNRTQHLKHRYGLTEEGYEKLLQYQNGGCAICGKPQMNSSGKRLAVDHDHMTTRWRGLLCGRCNAALAWYEQYASDINDYLLFANKYRGMLPQHRDPVINVEIG